MARRTRQMWRWRLNCAGAAGQCGGGGETSGRQRPVVGKTTRWSPRAVARSCSSKEEGRGEAPTDVKHTTRGVSSHLGGCRRRSCDENPAWNGGFQ
jgi:hypothetical protein